VAAGGRVKIEIADDGMGGADTAAGTGLRGLADRVEAIGGTFLAESPAGRGTRLVASVPFAGR
jgi:signal transduction histidine kinase